MTIPIAEHVKNVERLRVHRDGDAFFVAWDDFVDLQESPAYFIKGERDPRGPWAETLRLWWSTPDPLVHLLYTDRCYLSKKLMAAERKMTTGARR